MVSVVVLIRFLYAGPHPFPWWVCTFRVDYRHNRHKASHVTHSDGHPSVTTVTKGLCRTRRRIDRKDRRASIQNELRGMGQIAAGTWMTLRKSPSCRMALAKFS
jgi:hypothetical protein